MAEENQDRHLATQEHAGPQHIFDALAIAFYSGKVSRRRVLEVMGKTLVGTVLASIPGVASTATAAQAQSCEFECLQEGDVQLCLAVSPTGRFYWGPEGAPDVQCVNWSSASGSFGCAATCGRNFGVCVEVGFSAWRCRRQGRACIRGRTCCSYHGPCTGSTIWPRPAPTRCVTSSGGFTHCCRGWNLYPWIRECDDGTRTQGCGFCFW